MHVVYSVTHRIFTRCEIFSGDDSHREQDDLLVKTKIIVIQSFDKIIMHIYVNVHATSDITQTI